MSRGSCKPPQPGEHIHVKDGTHFTAKHLEAVLRERSEAELIKLESLHRDARLLREGGNPVALRHYPVSCSVPPGGIETMDLPPVPRESQRWYQPPPF